MLALTIVLAGTNFILAIMIGELVQIRRVLERMLAKDERFSA